MDYAVKEYVDNARKYRHQLRLVQPAIA